MKQSLFVALSLLAVTLAGLAQGQPSESPLAIYYPLKPGNEWTYRSGKEKVVIRCERAATLEIGRDDKLGKSAKVNTFVLKIQSGARVTTEQVGFLSDGIYRFAAADKLIKPPLRILKAPLNPNKKEGWPIECKTEDGKVLRGTFVSGTDLLRLTVNGKAVELPAITVTSQDVQLDDAPMTLTYWFAPGYGVVKQHVRIGKHETTLELESFRPAP